MKKKIQKPLKLNRETLTLLNHGDLQKPVGMAPTQLCPTANGCQDTNWTCAWVNGQCVGY